MDGRWASLRRALIDRGLVCVCQTIRNDRDVVFRGNEKEPAEEGRLSNGMSCRRRSSYQGLWMESVSALFDLAIENPFQASSKVKESGSNIR